MSKSFDNTLRWLLDRYPEDWLRLIGAPGTGPVEVLDTNRMLDLNHPDPVAARRMLKNLLRSALGMPVSQAQGMANAIMDRRPLDGFKSKAEIESMMITPPGGTVAGITADTYRRSIRDLITVYAWRDHFQGGFRVPCIVRWPGKIKPGTVENGLFSGLDWFPTLVAAAGNPNITDELLKGVKLGDRTYKNHLDGYNQMDLLTGKGPSKRRELFYFGGPHLGAIRIDDFKFQFFQQPQGWPGPKVVTDMPGIVNIRQDPFERTPSTGEQSLNDMGGGYMNDFYAREFWRFVLVQQKVAELAKTAIDFPPMQDPASFNLDAIKKQIDEMIKNHHGQ